MFIQVTAKNVGGVFFLRHSVDCLKSVHWAPCFVIHYDLPLAVCPWWCQISQAVWSLDDMLMSSTLPNYICQTAPSLLTGRQHLNYGDCLEVKREYYQNCSVVDCVTQCSQSALQYTYMRSSYRSNRLGLSNWDPYTVRRGSCLELYYSNMVECFCGPCHWTS